ncbi:MAG TPA: selenide, water dikinase SelD [Solirubrobacteraceae bacterium]|nr:selenide, water dikinase SelD [Solirubrobacteraceae bacterium]
MRQARLGVLAAAPETYPVEVTMLENPHTAVPVALTSLAHGAGCGCKLPAAALLPIVRGLPAVAEPRLLVGSDTADDAAVFKLNDEIALVMTIDFFTPIVADPYDFGRIAAANALSDVYAMGGRPLAAMNVVAFPLEQLGADILREIMRGGADIAAAAGISIVCGHSIDDTEPKYGLAVTGTVHPAEVISNAGARPGDVLVLTKPLGVGAITTARKRGQRDDDLLARGIETMTQLNDRASEAARAAGARAMTDVTGFGLLGHLHSLGRASGVAAEIDAAAVPAIDGVLQLLAGDDAVSGGSRRNRDYAATFTTFASGVAEPRRRLLCDATTSGGLLVAVAPEGAPSLPGAIVGEIVAGEPGAVAVR